MDWTWPPVEGELKQLMTGISGADAFYDDSENVKDDDHVRRAAHCMFYAECDLKLVARKQEYPIKYAVMMQMRFDGKLGFPGGIIDHGETILEGLNRELREEIGLDLAKYKVQQSDYICHHFLAKNDEKEGKKYSGNMCYFFAKQLTYQDFVEIEKRALEADDYGTENLGQVRVPLWIFREVEGLPRFLTNSFCGTGKEQLLLGIYNRKILSQQEIIDSYRIHHH